MSFAVGTRVTSPPRTDPYGPNSGIRLVWGFRCQGGITPLSSFVIPFFGSTCAAALAVIASPIETRKLNDGDPLA